MIVSAGSSLSQAVGIAISPLPIVLVILMLVSARARVNGPAFAAGWVVGVAGAGAAAFLLAESADAAELASGGADGVHLLQLTLGVFFVVLAVRQFRRRPRPGDDPGTPKLFDAVDSMGPGRALVLGVAAVIVNPKNLPLSISGGAEIASTGATAGVAVAALAVFTLVSSATVMTPVVLYFALGERSARILEGWKTWLITNNATIMTVLFTVLGASSLGEGLGILG